MNYDHLRESTHAGSSTLLSTRDDITLIIRSSFDKIVQAPGKRPLALAILSPETSQLLSEIVKRGALHNYPDIVTSVAPSDEEKALLEKKEYVGGSLTLEGETLFYFRSKRRRNVPVSWKEELDIVSSLASEGDYQEALNIMDEMNVEERNQHTLNYYRSQCCFYVEKKDQGLEATNSVALSLYNDSLHRSSVMKSFPFYVTKALKASRVLSVPRGNKMALTEKIFVGVSEKGEVYRNSLAGTRVEKTKTTTVLPSTDFTVFGGRIYDKSLCYDVQLGSEKPVSARTVQGALFVSNGELDGVVSWQPITLHSGKKYARDEQNWSEFQSCTPGIPYKEGSLFIVRIVAENKSYYRLVYLTETTRHCSLPIFIDPIAQVDIISIDHFGDEFVISYQNSLTKAACVAWYDKNKIEKLV